MKRPAYIVIHGTGGTLIDVICMLQYFDSFKCFWSDGNFYVGKELGNIFRKLFNDIEGDNRFIVSLCKMAVSRMLLSCQNPCLPEKSDGYSKFQEMKIIDSFPDFGIPFLPGERLLSAKRLREEALLEMKSLISPGKKIESPAQIAEYMLSVLRNDDGAWAGEEDAFSRIAAEFPGSGLAEALLQFRDMNESGADLDTVSSAVFYAQALKYSAESSGGKLIYGKDFRFIFVNYHQGLRKIADNPVPGDIYMADIPVSTVPDWRGDLIFLREKGFALLRYEDHHPYTEKQIQLLEELKKEGLIQYYSMSGPLQGSELPDECLKCGGDMVYEALLMGTSADNPAMAFLRKCVHGEDLAKEREETGKILTDLIKGGINSTELVQLLLSCREKDDIERKLSEKGWKNKILKDRELILSMSHKFLQNIQLLETEKPATAEPEQSGPGYCSGSDMPLPLSKRGDTGKNLKIAVMLAPYSSKKEPKLKIGKAQEFIAGERPDIDYLLYCYGSSLIVSRRLNQADTSLNLSVLMRELGTENDGGHSGAAVCNPENNPCYPHSILGHVNSANFNQYCRYLSEKISGTFNVKVISRHDVSVRKSDEKHVKAMRQLLWLLLATLGAGLAVILFDSSYRPQNIMKLNKDFFAWFKVQQDSGELVPPDESPKGDE